MVQADLVAELQLTYSRFACSPVVRKEDHVMTGFPQFTSPQGIVCCICAGPIALEASNTDERGKAVHEECYVRKTISRFSTASAVQRSENWLTARVVRLQLRLRGTLFPARQRNGNSAGLPPELPATRPRPRQANAATFRDPNSSSGLVAGNT